MKIGQMVVNVAERGFQPINIKLDRNTETFVNLNARQFGLDNHIRLVCCPTKKNKHIVVFDGEGYKKGWVVPTNGDSDSVQQHIREWVNKRQSFLDKYWEEGYDMTLEDVKAGLK